MFRASLIAKKTAIDSCSHFPDLSRKISQDLTNVLPVQWPLLMRRCWCSKYIHFALHLWLPCTLHIPTLRHYQHNVLWSMLPICHAVGNTVDTRGDRHHRTDNRLVYSPYNSDIVTSTRQWSIPFVGGGDTLVAAAVVTMRSSSCTTVWCGWGYILCPPQTLC